MRQKIISTTWWSYYRNLHLTFYFVLIQISCLYIYWYSLLYFLKQCTCSVFFILVGKNVYCMQFMIQPCIQNIITRELNIFIYTYTLKHTKKMYIDTMYITWKYSWEVIFFNKKYYVYFRGSILCSWDILCMILPHILLKLKHMYYVLQM